jgi:hypothetical protein
MAGVASARVANRRALHFVYYSAIKKTVSGLTKRVRGACLAAVDACISGTQHSMQTLRTCATAHRVGFYAIAEKYDEIRIFLHRPRARSVTRSHMKRAHARQNSAYRRSLRTCVHSKKNFAQITACEGVQGLESIKKRRIGPR